MAERYQEPAQYNAADWIGVPDGAAELSDDAAIMEMLGHWEPGELPVDWPFEPVPPQKSMLEANCAQAPVHNAPICSPTGVEQVAARETSPCNTSQASSPISPCSDEEDNVGPSPRSFSFGSTFTPSDTSTPRTWSRALTQMSPYTAFKSPIQQAEGHNNLDGHTDKIYVPDTTNYDDGQLPFDQLNPQQYHPQELEGSHPPTKAQKILQAAGYDETILGPWERSGTSPWVRRSQTVPGSSHKRSMVNTSCRMDHETGTFSLSPQEQQPAANPVHIRRHKSDTSIPRPGKHHKKWEAVPCLKCDQVFTGQYGRGNLNRHVKQKHQPTSEISCRVCKKTYKRTDALRKHVTEKQHW